MTDKPRRERILVIDDSADFRELVDMIGRLYGIPVLQAADCREGLKVLTREQATIKLIILDYFMPGMEPAACAKSIRAKAGSSIPVVLVTAAMDPRLRASELHITRWISKPVDPDVLTELMTGTG